MFTELKNACLSDWNAYIQHDFVRAMADGSLDPQSFKHYLKQDYLFLIQFTRAWGLSIYKSENFQQMRFGQACVNAMLDMEIALHIKYCQEWGISEEQLLQEPESSACVAYSRYVLDRGLAGDLLQLHVALAPCVIGYAEIAQWIMAQPFTQKEGNPYRAWIEMYAGAEYQEFAQLEIQQIRELAHAQVPNEELFRTFKTATRMEVAFWDMGLQRLS